MKMLQNLVQPRSRSCPKKSLKTRGRRWTSSNATDPLACDGDSIDSFCDPLDTSHSSLRTHTTLEDSRLFYSSLDLSAQSHLDHSRGSRNNSSEEEDKTLTSGTEACTSDESQRHYSSSSSDTDATVPVIQEEWEEGEPSGESCVDAKVEGELEATVKTDASTLCCEEILGEDTAAEEEPDHGNGVLTESLHSVSTSTAACSDPSTTVQAALHHRNDSSTKKQVSFGNVEIYEHAVALGGAVPSGGPSLTIQWDSQAYYNVTVEDYEEHRPTSRKGTQLLRSRSQRIQVLLDLGYTMRQINEDSRQCEQVRRFRAKASRQFSLWTHFGLSKSFRRMKTNKSL